MTQLVIMKSCSFRISKCFGSQATGDIPASKWESPEKARFGQVPAYQLLDVVTFPAPVPHKILPSDLLNFYLFFQNMRERGPTVRQFKMSTGALRPCLLTPVLAGLWKFEETEQHSDQPQYTKPWPDFER